MSMNVFAMHIIFLLCSDLAHEQRINKEIETLIRVGKRVSIVDLPLARSMDVPRGATHHALRLLLRGLPKTLPFWILKYCELVARQVLIGVKSRADIVHCVDRLALIPGLFISLLTGCSLIYDSQEIWPEVRSSLNKPRWLWLWIERTIARRCRVVLVTDMFRKKITTQLLRLSPERVIPLMNVPRLNSLVSVESDVRSDAGRRDGNLVVYAGGISQHRHLEDLVAALAFLPRSYQLAIVGFGSPDYLVQLNAVAADRNVSARVSFLPAVRWNEVSSYIRTARCTIALYEKNSANNVFCSPSKVFDSLFAGVPVVSMDSPFILELQAEVGGFECLDVVTPAGIAAAIERLAQRYASEGERDDLRDAARLKYCWEAHEQQFTDIYSQA